MNAISKTETNSAAVAVETGLRIDDLAANAVELSEEEIRAVSGGGFCGSWTSGGCGGTDEWVRC
jgi:hypothetical protein